MIQLEYFVRNDFQQLIDWLKDDELLMNWSGSLFSFPLTQESLEWYIQDVNIPDALAYIYKVVEPQTGKVIGHISLGSVSKKNRSARITRVLIGDLADRGKGYCKQMIKAVMKIGFEELNLHRISLGVYDFNSSAIKCYESAGLIIEGKQRDVLFFKDTWWSLVEMSMLQHEWQQKPAN